MDVFDQRPDLLRRFKAGEREALSTVYWAYVDQVERVIRRGFVIASSGVAVSGLAHRTEVRDLIQDVFVRAFSDTARQAYDGVRPYAPFLLTIARHRLVDWAREQGRQITLSQRELELLLGEDSAAPEPPRWSDPEALRVAERYLADIAPDVRGVYTERYVNARSQVDAAATLGISRQKLRRLEQLLRTGLSRAIARAKRHLGAVTNDLTASPNVVPSDSKGDSDGRS